MKTKFTLITAVFIISIFIGGKTTLAGGVEKEKEFHQTWAVSEVQTLEVLNKYGEIKVKNDGGSQITIDVTVTVEAGNERKAGEVLSMIKVNFHKSSGTAKATTSISNNFKHKGKFSIDYEINIPSNKNLVLSNKYGNTFVNELNAKGDFNIQYGNLTANALNSPGGTKTNILLAYGNASVGTGADMNVDIKYSNMTIGEIDDLKLESKYSVVEVEEGSDIQIESKYDKFKFEEVESVTATTKYSHLRIEELAKSLKIEAGYGGIRVEEVAPDFENISITNSYGDITLGLDNTSYSVDASCEYCGISFPEDDFSGDRIKESKVQKLIGNVGSENGGTVKIKSRYGSIKLRD